MLCLDKLHLTGRLDDICIASEAGQFIHIIGPNGAGKSSLLSVIAGTEMPSSGVYALLNNPIEHYSAERLAAIRCFQQQQQFTPFSLKVSEVLMFFGRESDLPKDIVRALDIGELLNRQLLTLSGGEQRRVQIAKALLQIWPVLRDGTALILLDEPTQGLDFRHQHMLFKLLSGFVSAGHLVICSHHDLNLAHKYASQVFLMKKRRLVACGTPDAVMTEEALSALFDCKVTRHKTANDVVIFQSYLD